MKEYQCGVRSEDLIPFEFSLTNFNPLDWGHAATESVHDKEGMALSILITLLAIPLLCILAFFWIKDRVSNFMTKLRHRRFYNEEVSQVLKEQVPDHIRGY